MTGGTANQGAGQGIAWSDDFLIGIEKLDYEHRRLIEDINNLHGELLAEAATERIEETLGSIHARMQAHFALEESVMTSHGYPHFPEHKAEHEGLLDEYAELMTKVVRHPDRDERADIANRLCRWIVDHILTSDRKMSLMVAAAEER